MFIKAIILLMFIAIFISLGRALYFLAKDNGQSKRTVKALTYRMGLSIALLVLILIAFATGAIKPHGLRPAGMLEKSQN